MDTIFAVHPGRIAHEVVQAVQQHVPGVKQIQDITQQEQFFQLIVADVSESQVVQQERYHMAVLREGYKHYIGLVIPLFQRGQLSIRFDCRSNEAQQVGVFRPFFQNFVCS